MPLWKIVKVNNLHYFNIECEVSGCEECYVNYEICTRCESGKELKEKPWGGFECKESKIYIHIIYIMRIRDGIRGI